MNGSDDDPQRAAPRPERVDSERTDKPADKPERPERPTDRPIDRPIDRPTERTERQTERAERQTERAERAERVERERVERHDRGEDTLAETIRQKLEQLVPDLVKKTFSAGMGAVFQTEEGIRRVMGGARDSLPEVAGYIASSADGAKDKVFEVIARETREFLGSLNLTEEIAKILTTLSFEIKTEVRFIPNSERIGGAVPDVKASVRLKRNDEAIGRQDRDKDRDKDRDTVNDEPAGRDSRSRLRFWRRDGEEATDEGEDHDK